MAEFEHIIGLEKLSKELDQLAPNIAKKVLRGATAAALKPTFKLIKLGAPVGSKPHKTYKGNWVGAGFLSRNIKLSSSFRKGRAIAKVKTTPEAFYGVTFLDEGTGKISARHWFARKFEKDRRAIEGRFGSILRDKIRKLTA